MRSHSEAPTKSLKRSRRTARRTVATARNPVESESPIPPFELIPAIDLLDGRCVRLAQGRYDEATIYGEDPGAVAAGFAAYALARLHVVDLDGAKAGETRNGNAIRGIVAGAGAIPVQLGGGIRTVAAIESALELGIDRVILGTVALRDPELVRVAARRFPQQVVVGIDARDGRVAVEGWLEESDAGVIDVAKRFEDAGVAAIVYTDIARDGMLTGPNFDSTAALADAIGIPVILSGGVGSEDDVVRAAGFAGRGVAGAIVGRAIYTGAVDIGRTLRKLSCC
jgi:phosphoribosylformimino-5-aminoimidazole carboxamide ribotide isomerase